MDRRCFLATTAGAAALAGCASAPDAEPGAAAEPPLWPAPPELPRYIYEATLRNAASLRDESREAQLRRLLTGDDASRLGFAKPMAVAAGRGRIYVCDTEGRRIVVFDVPRRRTFVFGTRFEGELKRPAGIALDGEGKVHVVDSTARRVIVYDPLGLFLHAFDEPREWSRPTALAVSADGARIYVVDTGGVESASHRITVHGRDGKRAGVIGRRGGGDGEFNLPTDAAVGPDGTLWVLDAGNFRVQAFDADGRFVRAFGSVGNAVGQFARPRGIAVDREGLVYVSDAVFCNVQVFQPDGTLLLALGSRAAERDAPGRYRLPAKLASDETGRLYVVDQYLHKIDVLRRLAEAEGLRYQRAAATA